MIDRRSLIGVAAGALASGVGAVSAQARDVDLALVLAADCSGSVRAGHYVLQQQGYAAAFRQPDVIRAIRGGFLGAIAVMYFQWSGPELQFPSIGWTILKTPQDIDAFARTLEELPRTIFAGGTSPGGAISFGHRMLETMPVRATRRVIDVSGDGRTNRGPEPDDARAAAVQAGITINGLPILHLEPDIDDYYAKAVIGGPGAFIVPARDFSDFGEAVRRKLIQEIAAADASRYAAATLAGRPRS